MEIQQGEWYFCVECSGCHETIYFSHDPLKGKVEVAAHDDSVIKVNCPSCNSVDDYHSSQLISREAKVGVNMNR